MLPIARSPEKIVSLCVLVAWHGRNNPHTRWNSGWHRFPGPCPAMIARAKGEAALIFATLPDGFDRATEVMNDLISEELAAHTLLVLGMRTARGEKI